METETGSEGTIGTLTVEPATPAAAANGGPAKKNGSRKNLRANANAAVPVTGNAAAPVTGNAAAATNNKAAQANNKQKAKAKLTLELLLPSMRKDIAEEQKEGEESEEIEGHVTRLTEYLVEIQKLQSETNASEDLTAAQARFDELKQLAINELSALRSKTEDPDDLLEEYTELAQRLEDMGLLRDTSVTEAAPAALETEATPGAAAVPAAETDAAAVEAEATPGAAAVPAAETAAATPETATAPPAVETEATPETADATPETATTPPAVETEATPEATVASAAANTKPPSNNKPSTPTTGGRRRTRKRKHAKKH